MLSCRCPRLSPVFPARLRALLALLLGLVCAWAYAAPAAAQGQPITFSVTGDIPYSGKEDAFQDQVADHNRKSPSEFFFHVGDIKSQTDACPASYYQTTFDIMSELAVPSFIVPGDNEWNDCADPPAAWALWEAYFTDFEQNFCGAPAVEAQAVRHENFAFVRNGVLFIGLNLVGGRTYDSNEKDRRLQDDADWVETQFTSKAPQVRAAVIIAHAERSGSRDLFFDQFDASASAFGKPILFIHGNTHDWAWNTNWGAPNISRISIEQNDPPLQVTVSLAANPFSYVRNPWPSGTPDWNQPPCVEAGPDQNIDFGDTASLDAFLSDDGVPVSGSLSLAWSTFSGPGGAQASFSKPNQAATNATFPTSGTYVLRLTANDGQLSTSDDVSVVVQASGPQLRIGDASVVEGNSGTTSAVFTVELLAATGGGVTVDYATADGSAKAGSDYQARSGSLSFSGSTTTRTVSVPVIGDTVVEEIETFSVNLSGASGAAINVGTGTGIIVDNDVPPGPTVSSFTPTKGPAGTVVTVNGQAFTGTTAVSVGGVVAGFTLVSDTQLRFTVPGNAKSGPVRVTNGSGTGTSAASFTMEYFLTLTTVGAGSVSLQPVGGRYAEGTSVVVTPSPEAGSEFLYWRGDYGGLADPATIVMNRNKSVIATFVPAGSVVRVPVDAAGVSDSDDAEERLASGSVKLTSGDLELGYDGSEAQMVGMRFAGVDVPQGATVLSATVQFTVDEVSTGAASLIFRGEGANAAAPFIDASENVSGRATTGASVPWSPPDWTSRGDAGAAQRSPDLASIVQEIVARPGWVPGNPLAIFVTGSGRRTAESYDGGSAVAPRLSVIYQGEPDEEPPTVPGNLRSPVQGETTIDLAWDAAADDVGVTAYRVYGPFGSTLVSGTSTVVTGLAIDTPYDFQVSALDEAGNESDRTPVLTVSTLPPDMQPPSQPQNLRSTAQTGSTISLAWNASSDDRGVAGYRVYGPGGSTDVSATSHVVTGLSPLAEYGFQVSALDGAGNESELTPVLLVSTNAADPVPLSLRIALGGDDAEERLASGSVKLTSGDLELGFDGSREQAVGLRFAGLDVPSGATILSASLLFTADEVKTGPASLSIRGVAADDAPSFSGTAGVSSQPTTDASVAWSPPDWMLVGEAGPAQRTPDLTDIVQEIVSRPGWAANQALAFVITGTGTRTAEAFEGRANSAPLLELVYIDQPDVTDPSTPQNLRWTARSSVSIDLAWDASSDDRGVTGYRVAWPGGSTIVAETSWVATDLSPSTAYSFQVSALDAAANESAPTTPLVVSTLAPDLTDPSVPQSLHSPAQTGTTIELAWDPSSDNVGVSGYVVYGPFGATLVSGTSHVETGLVPATPYSFQVSALDAAGNESDLSPALVVATGASDPVEFRVRIASDGDDVEEALASSTLDVTSSDLELIQAGSKLQLVGMRFLGIPVPQGAHIAQAYIQFTVDETGSDATNLTLRAELASNAAPFGNGAGLPSARTTTAAYATWSPPAWTSVGAAEAAQQTPDLAALIQEVVDQPGWTPGNALVLLVSGSGKRTAEAHDGVAASAPELVLVYEP